jgi:hypothetical protein
MPVSIADTDTSVNSLIKQNPAWEAKSLSASDEIPPLLRNPEVRDRVYKSPVLVPVLSHTNQSILSHTTPLRFISTLSLSLHEFVPTRLFPHPPKFSYQTFMCTPHPYHACYMHDTSSPPGCDYPNNI